MNKNKKLTRSLTLNKETLRTLTGDETSSVNGGNWATVTVATVSFQYCGSRNGCATLDCDKTPTVGCPRGTTL